MKRLSVSFLLVAAIAGTSTSAFCQTVWFKYVGNPVLTCGQPGTWDNAAVYPDRVIFQDSIYLMWYSGRDGLRSSTGLATSRNGVDWVKSTQNPVLSVGPGSWESGAAYEGFVDRVDSGYEMWYTGDDGSGNWKLGYAFSRDGIVWTKANGANPVIGTGSWYAKGPHNPSVLGPDNNGGYKMWFQGNPIAHADVQIGYATATNETTWTVRTDPVFSYGTPGSWDDDKVMHPKVLFDGHRYEMWYGGEESDGVTEIGYATSSDGISWTRWSANPVLGRGPTAWDLADLYNLDVSYDGRMYHMWYGGRLTLTSLIQGVGYAVSPKGLGYTVSSRKDSILVLVRAPNATGLSFSAEMESPDNSPVDTLELFDDGAHGDSLAGDGVFANAWKSPRTNTYFVDLKLTLNTLKFELNNAATVAVVSTAEFESTTPASFYLAQNYPNPFNPGTTISYQIPQAGLVSLKVYNTLGVEVATLASEFHNAGFYQVQWTPQLPSGIYFYRLQAGPFAETKKLLLLK